MDKEIMDKENCKVTNPFNSTDLTMSRDIMEYEMNSGKIYAKDNPNSCVVDVDNGIE